MTKKAVCRKNNKAISVKPPAKATSPIASVKKPRTLNIRPTVHIPFPMYALTVYMLYYSGYGNMCK